MLYDSNMEDFHTNDQSQKYVFLINRWYFVQINIKVMTDAQNHYETLEHSQFKYKR